jgi:hypothetical protein
MVLIMLVVVVAWVFGGENNVFSASSSNTGLRDRPLQVLRRPQRNLEEAELDTSLVEDDERLL